MENDGVREYNGPLYKMVKIFLILIGLEPIMLSSMDNLIPYFHQIPSLPFSWKFVSWYVYTLKYDRDPVRLLP